MTKIGCQMAFNEYTAPDFIGEAGAYVEELGFHSLWVPEHVLFFSEYESRYPYTEDGRIQGDPRSLIDPFSALTFLAAHTRSIRLGSGICIVPQRNPVYTARQVSDLDYLSGGRVDFGIGIGWLKEEFAALGVPWPDRAGRTRECVAVMKTLWCDEVSHFQGKYFNIDKAYQNPKPVQMPHPPLIFGGESEGAFRRVAELGQGWYGFNMTPAGMEQNLAVLDAALATAGRSREELQIHISPAYSASDKASIAAMAALGADQIILPVLASTKDKLADRAKRALELVQG
ncbi:LLM class F420-dependent oxidoreductase [Halieaceae bacterium IMCC14734]|uniref:LLM class F420-dependent oxidoreductase n=1 Tax=Candidatus Litorirhabdus singularis TaxID=2518993 RepID=A0ABT3TG38_9GAMM|nr:LLM class F420-dependent oxidoreductase [Candidatus Litorirhabdus singularis]MCX2981004.1 LLM class F420-dependent oxidoreductase [Candidatus Litorirhabdus singularis]